MAVFNTLTYLFSNSMIEGTNNLIQVIKRLAFGYRSFIQLKTRILLISNNFVPCRFPKSKMSPISGTHLRLSCFDFSLTNTIFEKIIFLNLFLTSFYLKSNRFFTIQERFLQDR